jgi:hypothetical protein
MMVVGFDGDPIACTSAATKVSTASATRRSVASDIQGLREMLQPVAGSRDHVGQRDGGQILRAIRDIDPVHGDDHLRRLRDARSEEFCLVSDRPDDLDFMADLDPSDMHAVAEQVEAGVADIEASTEAILSGVDGTDHQSDDDEDVAVLAGDMSGVPGHPNNTASSSSSSGAASSNPPVSSSLGPSAGHLPVL